MMTKYRLKTGKLEKKVVGGYKKIEEKVTSTYKKIEDVFVDRFLEKVEENNNEEK